jgi:uncharacterized coiled-coil DUF342 family protein
MADATEELEKKRTEANRRADQFRDERDRLNGEARQWADRRMAIIDELRAKSSEAQAHRHERDALNEGVREEKRARDEANRQFEALAEKVSELKRTRQARSGGMPLWRLRKELKELEFRHMTTSLTKEAETRLLAEIQRLQREIRGQEESFHQDPEVDAAMREAETARRTAEEHHRLVGELAERAQREHELMVQLFEEVDRLRREADEVQAKLIEVKTASDQAHQAHIQAIEEVRDLEKMLHAARARALGQPEAEEPPKEEDLFARFKKGGKISTEDLMALQKSPR